MTDTCTTPDDPERAAERSATVGGYAGAVLGSIGGPVGAGVGGLIGGSTGYAVGYTLGKADRRPGARGRDDHGYDEPVEVPVSDADTDDSG